MGIDRCSGNGFAGTWDTIAPQRFQLAVLLPWELNGRYEIAVARIGGTKDFFLLALKVERSDAARPSKAFRGSTQDSPGEADTIGDHFWRFSERSKAVRYSKKDGLQDSRYAEQIYWCEWETTLWRALLHTGIIWVPIVNGKAVVKKRTKPNGEPSCSPVCTSGACLSDCRISAEGAKMLSRPEEKEMDTCWRGKRGRRLVCRSQQLRNQQRLKTLLSSYTRTN
ncbi:hypothetical protein MCOR31_003286 [Pyricularia oryzae]|uniref:Uncharacterized protein n=1 Tax=Pyricularia grisea TaxID=148305 RepID=A0ABQ8NAD9_PYRGI|nr:hypothetical protein MCOR01_006065 [Pyricularia oryzae]KAI6293905.1 hypothetical protein MCOR33_008818 [Pyricularia grisea]KAI6373376.1 hypothetical protein MCOR31_003286 [Pyricularia oryzae]KAI6419940.1 hypothetical protein MCOR21_010032 [Pyricularia oryzae]KAI6554652.1 hypothetical protein MCOR09_010252 [Pyricularia oryzae]